MTTSTALIQFILLITSSGVSEVDASSNACTTQLISNLDTILSTDPPKSGHEYRDPSGTSPSCSLQPDLSDFTADQLYTIYISLRRSAGVDVLKFYKLCYSLLLTITAGNLRNPFLAPNKQTNRVCQGISTEDLVVKSYLENEGTLTTGLSRDDLLPQVLSILLHGATCYSDEKGALLGVRRDGEKITLAPREDIEHLPPPPPPPPAVVVETDADTVDAETRSGVKSSASSPAAPRQIVDQTFRSLSIVNEENIFGNNLATVVYKVTELNYQAVDVAVMARVLDSYIMVLIKALDQLKTLTDEEKRINGKLADVLQAIKTEIGISEKTMA